MFKLLRLAIYALVGYAAYQFVTDVLASAQQEPASSRGGRRGGARAGGRSVGGNAGGAGGTPRLSGAKRGGGVGKAEVAQDADGATARHRVGRGVV
jgi:hypothetical protein